MWYLLDTPDSMVHITVGHIHSTSWHLHVHLMGNQSKKDLRLRCLCDILEISVEIQAPSRSNFMFAKSWDFSPENLWRSVKCEATSPQASSGLVAENMVLSDPPKTSGFAMWHHNPASRAQRATGSDLSPHQIVGAPAAVLLLQNFGC